MALALIDNLIKYIDENEEKSSGKCPFTGRSGASCTRVTKATQAALRKELEALISSKGCAPILVRLAWYALFFGPSRRMHATGPSGTMPAPSA